MRGEDEETGAEGRTARRGDGGGTLSGGRPSRLPSARVPPAEKPTERDGRAERRRDNWETRESGGELVPSQR